MFILSQLIMTMNSKSSSADFIVIEVIEALLCGSGLSWVIIFFRTGTENF